MPACVYSCSISAVNVATWSFHGIRPRTTKFSRSYRGDVRHGLQHHSRIFSCEPISLKFDCKPDGCLTTRSILLKLLPVPTPRQFNPQGNYSIEVKDAGEGGGPVRVAFAVRRWTGKKFQGFDRKIISESKFFFVWGRGGGGAGAWDKSGYMERK